MAALWRELSARSSSDSINSSAGSSPTSGSPAPLSPEDEAAFEQRRLEEDKAAVRKELDLYLAEPLAIWEEPEDGSPPTKPTNLLEYWGVSAL